MNSYLIVGMAGVVLIILILLLKKKSAKKSSPVHPADQGVSQAASEESAAEEDVHPVTEPEGKVEIEESEESLAGSTPVQEPENEQELQLDFPSEEEAVTEKSDEVPPSSAGAVVITREFII